MRGGSMTNKIEERLINLIFWKSIPISVCDLTINSSGFSTTLFSSVLSVNSVSNISRVFDSAFNVCPLGAIPDSILWIVLTEIPDFSESSYWVKFFCSLTIFNLDISFLKSTVVI